MSHRRRLCTTAALALSMLSAVSTGAQAAGAIGGANSSAAKHLRWNVAADFRAAPQQANPTPDRFGNPAVWHYLQGAATTDPAGYSPLGNFISDILHVQGLQGWRGDWVQSDEKDQLPSVAINTRDDNPRPLNIDWPPGTVLAHPLPSQTTIIGWRSPVDGRVAVNGAFVDRDANCGDGFSWSINRAATPLSSGLVPNGGSESFGAAATAVSDVRVNEGDFLYFVIGAGSNHDHICDSTGVDATITLLCQDKHNRGHAMKEKCRKR